MRKPSVKGAAAEPVVAPDPAPPVAARGEISISLGGETYTLTPSFEAIGQLETRLSLSLLELAALAAREMMTLGQLAEVVTAFIRANGRATGRPDLDRFDAGRIGQLIYASDGGVVMTVRTIIRPVLQLALYGGYDATGFRKLL